MSFCSLPESDLFAKNAASEAYGFIYAEMIVNG